MVDAWTPATEAAVAAADGGASPAEVLAAAADAAHEGAEATIALVATKGRASYLGERSAGHLDPGARSTELILRAAAQAAA
jgi:dihydroxyacetone kinase-like protein